MTFKTILIISVASAAIGSCLSEELDFKFTSKPKPTLESLQQQIDDLRSEVDWLKNPNKTLSTLVSSTPAAIQISVPDSSGDSHTEAICGVLIEKIVNVPSGLSNSYITCLPSGVRIEKNGKGYVFEK